MLTTIEVCACYAVKHYKKQSEKYFEKGAPAWCASPGSMHP